MKNYSLAHLHRCYFRLTLAAAFVLLFFAGTYTYLIPREVTQQTEQLLRQSAHSLLSVVGQNDYIDYTRFVPSESESGLRIQITNQVGTVLYSSFAPQVLALQAMDGFSQRTLGHQNYLFYQTTYAPTGVVVQVARPLVSTLWSTLCEILWPLAWGFFALILLASYFIYRRSHSLTQNLKHTLALRNGANSFLPAVEMAKLPKEIRTLVQTYQSDLSYKDASLKKVQASLKEFLVKLRQPFLVEPNKRASPSSPDEAPNLVQTEQWINCMHAWIVLDETNLQQTYPSDEIALAALIQEHFNAPECALTLPQSQEKLTSRLPVLLILLSFLRQYVSQVAQGKLAIELSLNEHEYLLDIHYITAPDLITNPWQREVVEFSFQIVAKAADIIEAVLVYNTLNSKVSLQILFPRQPSQGRLL